MLIRGEILENLDSFLNFEKKISKQREIYKISNFRKLVLDVVMEKYEKIRIFFLI